MFTTIRDFSGIAVNVQRQWSPAEQQPVFEAEAGAGNREAPVATIIKGSR